MVKKTGVIKVRLYRPFDIKRLLEAIPATCKNYLSSRQNKKNRALWGEPMYLDVIQALHEGLMLGYGSIKKYA